MRRFAQSLAHLLMVVWCGCRMWGFLGCQVRNYRGANGCIMSRSSLGSSAMTCAQNGKRFREKRQASIHFGVPRASWQALHGMTKGFLRRTQVAKAMPDADHAYMEWVTTYSAPTYQEVPAKLEQLIEDVGNKVTYGETLLQRAPVTAHSLPCCCGLCTQALCWVRDSA